MNQGVINFKICLREDGNTDIRRFTVEDPSVITNFFYIKEKLMTIFPRLRNEQFKITWTDSDNDEITITSDEDLITAFTEMKTDVKMLTITVLNSDNDMDAEPILLEQRVICDVCDKTITGYRYKCMQCPDFDLCAMCEQKGHHSQHIVMRISQQSLPRCMPKLMNCLARSIRKSGIYAAKEAYRTSKMTSRCNSFAGHGAKDSKATKTDTKNEKKMDCPMDGLLADLASSFLGGMAQVPPPPTENQNATNNNSNTNSQSTDVIGNIIRNVLSSFTTIANTAAAGAAAGAAAATDAAASAASAASADNSQAASSSSSFSTPTSQKSPDETPTTPMEVEPPKIYPNVSDLPREPGWTFVPPTETKEKEPSAPQEPSSALAAPSKHMHDEVILRGLAQLEKMGFTNETELLSLLYKYEGNIGMVINHLFEKSKE